MNCYYYDDDDGTKCFSKYDASNLNNPKLYYYDHIFDKCDWKTEPSATLSKLYAQRAQQIRDEHDYVVLAYSGGIDSTNVLESFYYNNLLIDEILIVGAFSRDSSSGVDENHNGEIYSNVFDTLNRLDLPKTKITMIDYTKNLDNYTLVHQDDWYKKIGSHFSFHNWFWYDIEKQYESNKKTAIIFGIDKPEISSIKNKTYFHFVDVCLFSYGIDPTKISSELFQTNVKRVNFYWDPNASSILIKQAHVINNFFMIAHKRKDIISKNFYDSYFTIVNKLIYNLKNPLRFISPKSSSRLISLRDNYVNTFDDFKDLQIYKNYTQGIMKIIPNEKKYTGVIKSKPYYLN